MARRMSSPRARISKRANKLAVESREYFQNSRYYLDHLLKDTGPEDADRRALTYAKLAGDRAQSYVEAIEEITE